MLFFDFVLAVSNEDTFNFTSKSHPILNYNKACIETNIDFISVFSIRKDIKKPPRLRGGFFLCMLI